MRYANSKVIEHMIHENKYDMGDKSVRKEQSCDTCVPTKKTSVPANGCLTGNSQDLAIHIDICGPLRTPAYCENAYLLIMTTTMDVYTEDELLTLKSKALHFSSIISNGSRNSQRRK